MCMNKEVSGILFLFVIMVFIKCILQQRYYDATIVMAYGLIQLMEFIIWSNINSININFISSVILCIILSLQPLAIALISRNEQRDVVLRDVNYALIALYILLFWVYLYKVTTNFPRNQLVSQRSGKRRSEHMAWKIVSPSYYVGVLSLLYLVTSIIVFVNVQDYLVLGLFISTYVVAVMYNYFGQRRNLSITGSVWCFLAILLIITFGIFT